MQKSTTALSLEKRSSSIDIHFSPINLLDNASDVHIV